MNDPSGVYYVYYSSKTLLLGPKYGAFAKSTRIYTQNEFEMWCLLQGTDIFYTDWYFYWKTGSFS